METVDIIIQTAKQKGISIAFLCRKIGVSSRTYFNDVKKHGRKIPEDKLIIIAEALGVSTEYLLGKTLISNSLPLSDKQKMSDITSSLSPHEIRVISEYRKNRHIQKEIDKLLGINDGEDYVDLYMAAHSDEKRRDEIVSMNREDWERIKNAPSTDEDFS